MNKAVDGLQGALEEKIHGELDRAQDAVQDKVGEQIGKASDVLVGAAKEQIMKKVPGALAENQIIKKMVAEEGSNAVVDSNKVSI